MMRETEFEEEQYVDVRSLPLKAPQRLVAPAAPVRRPWHPVMWDPTGGVGEAQITPAAEEQQSTPVSREYPHKQRIRNLKRLIAEGKVKPTSETLIFFLCNKFAVSEERQVELLQE